MLYTIKQSKQKSNYKLRKNMGSNESVVSYYTLNPKLKNVDSREAVVGDSSRRSGVIPGGT